MELEYRTFPLAPEPKALERFGSEEALRRYVRSSLERVRAQPGGERIRPEAVASVAFPFPYSMPALRAVKAAERLGGRRAGIEYFDRAAAEWFEEGRNVGDDEVLTEIAEEVRLDRTAFADALASPDRAVEVAADLEEAHRHGVTAVPTALMPNGVAVVGAQPEVVFRSAFESANEPQ